MGKEPVLSISSKRPRRSSTRKTLTGELRENEHFPKRYRLFTEDYTQTLKSHMSTYVTLKVLQFTLRKKSGCLGRGCGVYLSVLGSC